MFLKISNKCQSYQVLYFTIHMYETITQMEKKHYARKEEKTLPPTNNSSKIEQ